MSTEVSSCGVASSPCSPTTAPPSCIIGECDVRLSHPTVYEPPLYLFPELLTRVRRGSPPVTVWDAVADAVDVAASYWRFAEAGGLCESFEGGTTQSCAETSACRSAAAPYGMPSAKPPKSSGGNARSAHSLSTLAAMLGANRLLPAGLIPATLRDSNFSAASVIEELTKLQRRVGAGADPEAAPTMEGALLMSNHFINLLAWRKLKDINDNGGEDAGRQAEVCDTVSTLSRAKSERTRVTKRPRQETEPNEGEGEGEEGNTPWAQGDRDQHELDVLEHMKASPDPWSREVDEHRFAGVFISGRDDHADERVKLLRTLSDLYGKPWKRMRSQGIQTDHVVPKGCMNESSPLADPFRPGSRDVAGAALGPADLDAAADVNWCGKGCARPLGGPGSVTSSGFVVLLSALSESGGTGDHPDGRHDGPRPHNRRVPLAVGVTHFGRVAGPQSDPRVGPVNIDVGLAALAQSPTPSTRLSTLHFSLHVRPMYGESDDSQAEVEHTRSSDNDEQEGGEGPTVAKPQRVHRKSPTGFKVLLVNYGRNGVHVTHPANEPARPTGQWILGDVARLQPGSEVRVADAVLLRVLHEDTVGDSEATQEQDRNVKKESRMEEEESIIAPTASQVKVETTVDE